MNRLEQIIEKKLRRVAGAKELVSADAVRVSAQQARAHARSNALSTALSNLDRINIIAEFKRRSPSKGVIRSDANPEIVTKQYELGGAAAISVLTEEDHFDGSLDDLRAVRQATSLPILRKDFIVDEYQVYESAAAGADALLLIVAALDDDRLKVLRQLTENELGMDALIEVHTREEMKRAIACGAHVVGVNNRDLSTFAVSLQTSFELVTDASPNALLVSESGIETTDDIDRLRKAGYGGFLIGETLMRAKNPESLLTKFSERRDGEKAESPTGWLR